MLYNTDQSIWAILLSTFTSFTNFAFPRSDAGHLNIPPRKRPSNSHPTNNKFQTYALTGMKKKDNYYMNN